MLTLWGPQELPCDSVALLAFAYNKSQWKTVTHAPQLVELMDYSMPGTRGLEKQSKHVLSYKSLRLSC